ncbi:unnamed protein product [Fusarium venenatum]|uniref:Uncharacterized protein n=1 Tax=Fusarium venenatum TaxID=56646 RepID=A0A2L2SQP0_9HYPO|nr:uncharacterized protein FVRRES_13115 [Fusarium venenatum]CEI40443.1 unnamed protein product [Fusarium venenatum]
MKLYVTQMAVDFSVFKLTQHITIPLDDIFN